MPGECVVDTVSVLVDFLGTDYVKMCPGGEGRRYVRVSGHILTEVEDELSVSRLGYRGGAVYRVLDDRRRGILTKNTFRRVGSDGVDPSAVVIFRSHPVCVEIRVIALARAKLVPSDRRAVDICEPVLRSGNIFGPVRVDKLKREHELRRVAPVGGVEVP